MRVHLGCDHAGYELKNMLAAYLREAGHDVVDHGAHEYDPEDDYPEFTEALLEVTHSLDLQVPTLLLGDFNGSALPCRDFLGATSSHRAACPLLTHFAGTGRGLGRCPHRPLAGTAAVDISTSGSGGAGISQPDRSHLG